MNDQLQPTRRVCVGSIWMVILAALASTSCITVPAAAFYGMSFNKVVALTSGLVAVWLSWLLVLRAIFSLARGPAVRRQIVRVACNVTVAGALFGGSLGSIEETRASSARPHLFAEVTVAAMLFSAIGASTAFVCVLPGLAVGWLVAWPIGLCAKTSSRWIPAIRAAIAGAIAGWVSAANLIPDFATVTGTIGTLSGVLAVIADRNKSRKKRQG